MFVCKQQLLICGFPLNRVSAAAKQNNRSVCDKSMKFGTLIAKGIPKIIGYGDIMNFQHGAHGSHFSKWPLAMTVFL